MCKKLALFCPLVAKKPPHNKLILHLHYNKSEPKYFTEGTNGTKAAKWNNWNNSNKIAIIMKYNKKEMFRTLTLLKSTILICNNLRYELKYPTECKIWYILPV